jgi:hypothetical protein
LERQISPGAGQADTLKSVHQIVGKADDLQIEGVGGEGSSGNLAEAGEDESVSAAVDRLRGATEGGDLRMVTLT